MRDSQETVEMTEELKAVMDELELPLPAIAVGIRKGYEAHRIDPDKPAAPGNVIWAKKEQIQSFRDWADAEILGAFTDVSRSSHEAAREVVTEARYSQAEMDAAILAATQQRGNQRSPRPSRTQREAQAKDTKGREAYERRCNKERWADIGIYAINNAKSYAKSNSLPWPPAHNV